MYSFFNKWCWGNWTYTGKNINLKLNFLCYTKIPQNASDILNVKYRTIKFLEKQG